MITLLVAISSAYLIGSFPTGFLFGKVFGGTDIREIGSKSTGATNVMRLLGKRMAAIVLLIDVFKGFLAAQLVGQLNLGDWPYGQEWIKALSGIVVVIGHILPVWIGFRGGKGVGPAVGVMAILAPWETLFAMAMWLVVVATYRIVSLGSLMAVVFLFCALILQRLLATAFVSSPQLVAAGVIAVILVVSHRENIRRLLAGKEPRLGQSPPRL